MVFHLSDKQMLDSSSSGRASKKRGGFRRRKFSSSQKLAEAETPSPEPAQQREEALPPEGGVEASPAPLPEYRYNDERSRQAGRNARLRSLSYPVALGVGAALLFGGIAYGLESWIAAIAGSVGATIAYKLIDSRIR